MSNSQRSRLVLLLLGVGYLIYCLPLLFEAADDIAMVGVFSLDESTAAKNVRKMLNDGIATKPPFTYGGLFYYVPVILLNFINLFGAISEHLMAVVMRGVGMIAGLGCLWMTYRLGCRAFDRTVGTIGAALLVPLPVFLRWSVEAHPDLPQVFWMLCSLYVCCRMPADFRARDAWLSAGFAGLAFGTKYGGVFLLPVLLLAIVLAAKKAGGFKRLTQSPFVEGWVGVPIAFGIAFVLSNPHAVLDLSGLYAQVLSEKAIMTFGHMIKEDRLGIAWLFIMPGTMGWVNVLTVAAVLMGAIYWRARGERFADVHVILLVWIVILMGYLMLEVRVFYPRHLLQVLPVVLLFAGAGYQKLALWVVERVKIPEKAIVVALLLLACFFSVQDSLAMFSSKWGRAEKSVEIVAGRWLGEQAEGTATILYDSYAYVPSKFVDAFVITPAHTFPVVNHFEPEFMVLRDARFRRFQNLEEAEHSRVGKNVFYDIHYFYRFIKDGLIADYESLKDFDGVTIYRRRTNHNHTLSFAECKQLFASNQLINVGRAREVMGDAHFAKENWVLAARNYALGIQVAADYTTLHYKLGRAFIAAGDLVRGHQTFQKALDQIGEISDEEWANIYLDIAQSHFAAAFYSEALEWIEKALERNEHLTSAHFDRGACLLAMGKVVEAKAIYAQTVKRFGADASAVIKLEVLRRKKAYLRDAEQILAMYFLDKE